MRLLVAIASYGEKNRRFLRQIIGTYRAMTMTVDIVVVSEAPKDLPPGVRNAVGLPAKNPWSLPFAHKQVFADQVDSYDLFAYSEDDISISEAHIQAFLDATAVLKSDEIAGFLRYERDASGCLWMPDAHGMFHWKPESVVHRGDRVFAEYTNEHAAFYLITQPQLRRAIASGGFLRAPYLAKYDLPESAATDPYTGCGLRKMICISDLDPFLIHHMSDRYAGQVGLPLDAFQEQLETLRLIDRGGHPATTLCGVETQLPESEWSKGFYEKPHDALMSAVPAGARSVLSIGCGWGATEVAIERRGATVTALPLDSVIGAVAARRGIKPVYGGLDDCLARLAGQSYDCVLISNLLHLQREPLAYFDRCVALLRPGGTVVVDAPNFERLPVLAKRAFASDGWAKLRHHTESGVSATSAGTFVRSARRSGLVAIEVEWYDHLLPKVLGLRALPLRLGRFTAGSWVLRATRQ